MPECEHSPRPHAGDASGGDDAEYSSCPQRAHTPVDKSHGRCSLNSIAIAVGVTKVTWCWPSTGGLSLHMNTFSIPR